VRLVDAAILALGCGAALFALRCGAVMLGFGRLQPASPELEAWHLAATMGRTLPCAAAAGALAAALALLLRPAAAAALAAASSFTAFLSGWLVDDPGTSPTRARRRGSSRWRSSRSPPRCSRSSSSAARRRLARSPANPARLAAVAGLAALVPAGVWLAWGREPPSRPVRETLRELLVGAPSGASSLELRRGSAASRPHAVDRLEPRRRRPGGARDASALRGALPDPARDGAGVPARERGGRPARELGAQGRAADCAVEFEIEVDGVRKFAASLAGPRARPGTTRGAGAGSRSSPATR
jgi:hypothetical protein